MADSNKIKLAVQYANLLRSVLGNNLVSVFLFGHRLVTSLIISIYY